MNCRRQRLCDASDGRIRTVSCRSPSFRFTSCTRMQEVWYALVANTKFMFHDTQDEALAEQLREKKRFYGEQVRHHAAA
jgi:hypothetical protein